MSYSIFISDLHLDASRPHHLAALTELLAEHAGNADALYVLGDLFETWIGDDDDSEFNLCLLYTSPSPRDRTRSRMPSSA